MKQRLIEHNRLPCDKSSYLKYDQPTIRHRLFNICLPFVERILIWFPLGKQKKGTTRENERNKQSHAENESLRLRNELVR